LRKWFPTREPNTVEPSSKLTTPGAEEADRSIRESIARHATSSWMHRWSTWPAGKPRWSRAGELPAGFDRIRVSAARCALLVKRAGG
jgi:hypothetical protein